MKYWDQRGEAFRLLPFIAAGWGIVLAKMWMEGR